MMKFYYLTFYYFPVHPCKVLVTVYIVYSSFEIKVTSLAFNTGSNHLNLCAKHNTGKHNTWVTTGTGCQLISQRKVACRELVKTNFNICGQPN